VVRIVALGDSFTSWPGLPAGYRFPDKLEFALRARGQSAAVANAGVGGDTAARGLARLDGVITDDTDAVILELGAVDMLRGTDPNVTHRVFGEGTRCSRSQFADAAVTSISISNSGRASAATTSVVTAGGVGDAQRLRRSSPSVAKSAARVR
jgi:lysophospholipase L1-like esterase